MKIQCTVCVINRRLPSLPANLRKRPCKSTLALCRHPKTEEAFLILFSGQDKNGTKYSVTGNIKHVFAKFVNEGKCTIQLKCPEVDLCVEGDTIPVKGFLHLLKRAFEGKVSSKELSFSSMNVMPIKPKDVPVVNLKIMKRSDYPTRGFPRTLESLYVNNILRCGLDKDILQLHRLRVLDLSHNLIEYIPEDLNKLPNLKELSLSNNLLGHSTWKQWQWIGGFLSKTLQLLDLSDNGIEFPPDQLIKLENLVTLNLNNNNSKLLPCGLGNLRHLKVLLASNNLLTALPGSIKRLRLHTIDVSSNLFAQNVPDYGITLPKNFQVSSLKEYAAKKVLWARVPYPKGSIPASLIDYLDYAKYCVCGKAIFTFYLKQRQNLMLSIISEIVTTNSDSTCVPVDSYFCSLKCFNSSFRNRNPIIR